jgi:rhodanese-related sulfurtransferase
MDDPVQVYERRGELQIVDVRESYEWQAGHIEGAVHIPLADVMAGREKGQISTDRPVVLVCRSGNRSELASLMLQARGFDAHNLEGGMEKWAAAGLPFKATDGTEGRVA